MANSLEFTFILNGALSLGIVVFAIFVGLKIASKYFKIKRRQYLLVGFAWIGLVEPWSPSAISFLLVIFTGKGLAFELYVIIGIAGLPFFFGLWLIAFTDLLYINQQKTILLLYSIYSVIVEIIFFYLLFTNPTSIGVLHDPIDIEYRNFVRIFVFSMIVMVIISFSLFAYDSLKSEDLETKLKGKFLQLSIILWAFGAFLDALPLTLITLLVARICALLSSIGWYIGFLLPNWVKNIFLKNRTID